MKGFKFTALLLLLFMFFSGCSSAPKLVKFKTLDDNYSFKVNHKIAVLAGTNSDVDIMFATKLSEQLLTNGNFIVISQSEISRKISKYPLNHNIIDFDIRSDASIYRTEYLSETSKQKINEIGEKLKADYVLVIWTGSIHSVSNNWSYKTYIPVYSRMIDSKTKNVVGFSSEGYISDTILSLSGQPDEETVEGILLSASEGTIVEINKYFK